MMTVPLVDDRPRWVFKVKFQIQRVEGDGNVANAGVVGSNPLSSTRKSRQTDAVSWYTKTLAISVR